ncbi:uroporphyrin-III C-methyltransferase [Vibrio inusitatus NBRC 102082]|uniref:uroporphyrinogen-III C-methyltransferase n=1 Tax=Vibrio inusitatus NBRC 102082 TaxID=1219070 RepID=A0A4Y3HU51_9VIBR|nr:uroporphyrinogen-III C-methyltransferase [Vibrio inusitatus]GEA50290.1 uroporphyrin-III C-methyltransferase [Vibrio inusitatus NBRC 102082]
MTSKSVSSNQGGFVSLVGAGPGDPDLLTVKALRLIQKAEVIVYDRLVSPEIMALVNPDAELIYVGKRLNHHCVPQDQINQVLVDKAQQHKHVVRLKGGDSFIFGRGGEELEKLALEQIPFEVVPGITAAAGCTAYAGIPLTHRDHAQSVHFITGHLKKEGMDIDWASLSKGNTTLVFYMGLKESGNIQDKLITAGLSEETSIAIIERGTTPQQRVLTGTLSQLSTIAQEAESPSLIVVGSVTSLHSQLNWFE